MKRTELLGAVLLVVLAFGLLFVSVRSNPLPDETQDGLAPVPAAKVSRAPDWTLPDAQTGRSVSLQAEAQAHPVVFAFWATWCGPCRDELPHLQRAANRYRGRVAFYGINSNDPPQAIQAFVRQNKLTLPMLADTRRDVATRYGVETIPLLVVVDTKGNIRAVSSGYDPSEDLEASLAKLLDSLLAGH